MIKKTIHYIWLGKNKKPKNFKDIYNTWIIYAKNYGFEIIEWNDSNISEFEKVLPKYYYTAISKKAYAFASDVLRCFILAKYGGIYLDIDERLLKPLDKDFESSFLVSDFFTCYYHNSLEYFNFQFLGAKKDSKIILDMIDFYRNYKEDNFLIINSILSKILNKKLYKQTKYNIDIDKFLISNEIVYISKQDYFCPEEKYGHDFNLSYGLHIGNTSWIPLWKKILYKIPCYNFFKNIFFVIFNYRTNIKYK